MALRAAYSDSVSLALAVVMCVGAVACHVPAPPAISPAPSPPAAPAQVPEPPRAATTGTASTPTLAPPLIPTPTPAPSLIPTPTLAPSLIPTPTPAPKSAALSEPYLQMVRWVSAQVRQRCRQRVWNARAPGAPSMAIVKTTIATNASGDVQSVSTSGAPPGYPGLVACIEQQVRSWTFPPSSGKTVAQVRFVFTAPLPLPSVNTQLGCIGTYADGFEGAGAEETNAD